MKKINSFIIFVIILIIPLCGKSQDKNITKNNLNKICIETLKNNDKKKVRSFIRVNNRLGSLKLMHGFNFVGEGENIREKSLNLFNKIKAFLPDEHSEAKFKVLDPQKIFDHVYSVSIMQYFKDVPIINEGYKLIITDGGKFLCISGNGSVPVDKFSTTPIFSKSEVLGVLNLSIEDINNCTLCIILSMDEDSYTHKLIYEVKNNDRNYTDIMKYWVDAKSGKILCSFDGIESITGIGKVSQYHVLNQINYSAQLSNLTQQTPQKMNGQFIKAVTMDNPNEPNELTQYAESYDNPPTFSDRITSSKFKEVNAYYHGESFRQFMVNRGVAESNLQLFVFKVNAFPVARTEIYQRWCELGVSSSAFSPGIGVRDAAHDGQIIAHEYTHYLLRIQMGSSYTDIPQGQDETSVYREWAAMKEAYCDYFGLAYSNQWETTNIMGRYLDDPADDYDDPSHPYGRNWEREYINDYTVIDDYYNEIITWPTWAGGDNKYDRACIFGDALWRFRKDPAVQDMDADELVLKSISYLPSNPDWMDGREMLIVAAEHDQTTYSDNIEQAFQLKGLGTAAPIVDIDGPTELDFKEMGVYTAEVQFGENPFSYQWFKKIDGTSTWNFLDPGNEETQNVSMNHTGFYLGLVVIDNQGRQSSVTKHVDFGLTKESVLDQPYYSSGMLPDKYLVFQNYPNPFNPETHIRFGLPEKQKVTIEVYNLKGQKIATLANDIYEAGFHTVNFNASQLPSGIYFYKIIAGEFKIIKRMLLIK